MNFRDASPTFRAPRIGVAGSLVVLLAALGLSACGNKDKAAAQAPSQSLAKVNGEEITVHQINEELMRANVPPQQQEAARKQLLEALIDRQLLQGEALKEKMDRDPQVMAGIERAKTQMIAQAYMQKRVANIAKPSDAEIDTYFKAHPELFLERKTFEMDQLVVNTGDSGTEFKTRAETAKSLDELVAWLEARNIRFERTKLARNGADLPPELLKRMQAMRPGQMFMIKEGQRQMVVALANTRATPLSAEQATPMIAQYLTNRRAKEAADAELARLRAAAKIEYLNQSTAAADPGARPEPASAVAKPTAATAAAPAAGIERGVMGLK